MKQRRAWVRLAAVVAMPALFLSGCGSSDPTSTDTDTTATDVAGPTEEGEAGGGETIIIGSADFAESQLLAIIYSHALANAGVTVEEKLNIGSREIYIQALNDGSIDLLPEYTGYLLAELDPEATEKDPVKVVELLDAVLPDGIEQLDVATAEDKDVLCVTAATADQYGLSKISDLAAVGGEMVLAGPSEWKERYQGVPGLEDLYGITFKEFKVFDAGGPLTLAALVNGQAQAGDMFSSDPAIPENDLVALEDDKYLFMPAQVVPIIRTSKTTDTVRSTLNAVQAVLTTDDLLAMNARVNAGEDLEVIADDWLKEKGLL
ncbi:MAG: ABC transporter substrate-binding protein [Bifidobacteriaceae bacterium]|jgi:osmoprotectant transport system substrate-binding protein|nr:ABC transporter substrate-binding protein [Bifidobacteriaceae bacterium]